MRARVARRRRPPRCGRARRGWGRGGGRSPRRPRPSVASTQLAVAAHQRRGQAVGVLVQLLQAGGLGADEALAEHVLAVAAHRRPRGRPRASTSRPQVASQKGQVRWWTSRSRRLAYAAGGSRSSIQSACDAQISRPLSSNSAQPPWRLRPSIPSGQDSERVPLAHPHAAADPGGEPREDHRRPLAEVRDGRARGTVERAPQALRAHVPSSPASDASGVHGRGEDALAARDRARGRSDTRRRRRARAADHAGRERVRGGPRLAPGGRGRLGVVGSTGSGTSSRSSDGSPSATISPPSWSSTRPSSWVTASGRPTGGGVRSETCATRPRAATRARRTCSRRSRSRAGR